MEKGARLGNVVPPSTIENWPQSQIPIANHRIIVNHQITNQKSIAKSSIIESELQRQATPLHLGWLEVSGVGSSHSLRG
jgi:hypothetical protein